MYKIKRAAFFIVTVKLDQRQNKPAIFYIIIIPSSVWDKETHSGTEEVWVLAWCSVWDMEDGIQQQRLWSEAVGVTNTAHALRSIPSGNRQRRANVRTHW